MTVVKALCSLAVTLAVASPAALASIHYGDFVGGPGSVSFLAVTETTATPGDPEPLFEAPDFTSNTLVFTPSQFAASAPAPDSTSGYLEFMIDSPDGWNIHTIIIKEVGDYSLLGPAAATQVNTAVVVSSDSLGLNILADDDFGQTFTVPGGQIGDFDIFTTQSVINLSQLQVEDVYLRLDNTLQAIAPDGSTSFIQKKILSFQVFYAPEPATLGLLLLGTLGLTRRRRA